MIVKCEQCQTRFKIPDDKVTDKGVKVRCTKCSHTFRVTRDMAQPATGSMPALQGPPPTAPSPFPSGEVPGGDPFARFGSPNEPPMEQVTRPGVFTLGVEASKNPDFAPPVAPPKRQTGSSPAAPPYPAAPPAPFDFGSLTPPGASAPTVPAVPAFIPAATKPAPPPPPPAPAPAPFDFGSLSAPAAGAPPPAAGGPAAFDFSSFTSPATEPLPSLPASRPPPSAPLPPAAKTAAFDFGSPAPRPSPSKPAAPGGQLPPMDFGSPPPPSSSSASSAGPFDFGSPAKSPLDAMGLDLGPPPPGPSAKSPDLAQTQPTSSPFDDSPMPGGYLGSPEPSGEHPAMDGATARAMFDMPAPAPSAPVATLPDIPLPEPEAAPSAPPMSTGFESGIRTAPAALPPEATRRRTVFGVVVNVAIAAVLVVAVVVVGSALLNDGKLSVESLSLDHLKNTLAPTVDYLPSDVSNGLYETKAGRSVFFVRGEVLNRTSATAKVIVKAEIVEDGAVVRSAESLAGAPMTPEELFLLDDAESLEALNRRVEGRAVAIAPETAGTFVVAFTEFPPELEGFRVRVTARAVAGPPTAANP